VLDSVWPGTTRSPLVPLQTGAQHIQQQNRWVGGSRRGKRGLG
jgi:hypothetical protein